MQIKILQHRFLKDNIYLLLAALLLFSISVFTKMIGKGGEKKAYASALQQYMRKSQQEFQRITADTFLVHALATGRESEKMNDEITNCRQYLFIYSIDKSPAVPVFWSTQTVLPNEIIISSPGNTGFVKLENGYYFFQKLDRNDTRIISLVPVKWNYIVSNEYLKNDFTINAEKGRLFDISFEKNDFFVSDANNNFLFSLVSVTHNGGDGADKLTAWLRILAVIPLLIFIHFAALYINSKKGVAVAAAFLVGILLLLRALSYFLLMPLLRQFDLFDPAVYGSDIILRSLGDLLINAALFFWVINFIKNHLQNKYRPPKEASTLKKWLSLGIAVPVILFVTYTGGGIIRSMVADSQISFDVINFFSLDIYSVIGFLVLCCIAIGYYYFCRVIYFFLQRMFPDFMLPFFLSVAAGGLLLLSFRIGTLNGGFELFELIWLLVFLLLIKTDLAGFFTKGLIISKMAFWLFFFSASISAVIITENDQKEIRNRQHYAELIATKTDPASEVLLSTMLTEFRPELLADKFQQLTAEKTAGSFRDSLVNNNFSGYTDKYETKVLVYDSAENPLNNETPVSFNAVNTILSTQAKPASVAGLYYYDAGYDKFSYLSQKIIRNYRGALLGYVFIIITPRNFENEMSYPALFSRNDNSSLESSSEYAYAIYDNGRLVSSHNDYAFSVRYAAPGFGIDQFRLNEQGKYSKLLYNAGAGKYILIVKEKKVLIELITLFSYLFCSFLLLSAISWIIALALRSRFRFRRLKNEIQFTIRRQVHGTIIFFSAVSFIIIGISTILFFISRYETNNKETLSRTGRVIEKDFAATLTKDIVNNTIFQQAESSTPSVTQQEAARLSEVHGRDVNLYSLSGDLKASSLPLPYIKGIVSTKIDPRAFYHLSKQQEIQYFHREHIGALDFVSDYIPVTDSAGNQIAYLNIPYFTSQTRLREEISDFLVTIINLNAFIFLIAGLAALIITNRITGSFSFISDKMKKINLGSRNEHIQWSRNDEIGALVKEYNRMLAKLDESAASLARTERENAWQEMAKQVAHEIKNPLTPMKLSMQFLQRSIEHDAPGIKALGTRVSATLIEQIDHLSTIAGEFSRFANIEKASPEIFDLNESLRSAAQLHEGDHKTVFTQQLLPGLIMINADRTHINRMLTNLILNGIQAVPQGMVPHIMIGETIQDKNVIIQITDNGSGISDEAKEKIFTPNFTTKSSGTGLGLAMCKRMAEQAGGNISYETSATGTSFFITLPLRN